MSKRLKFFFSHLTISACIALLIVGLVFFIWYQTPLAQAVGVTHLFFMMLAIDVVVGPVLGFIVYKEGKKTLKFDLSVIISIQIIALCYGVYSIEKGRPAWITYNVDRFELVRKNEIIEDHISLAKKQYQHVSLLGPQFVAVEFAKDMKTRNDDMFVEALGGISISQKPERYVPLEQVKIQIQKRMQGLSILYQYNVKEDVEKVIKKYPQAQSWVPLKASAVDMVVLLDKDAQVVKIVDLRPWK